MGDPMGGGGGVLMYVQMLSIDFLPFLCVFLMWRKRHSLSPHYSLKNLMTSLLEGGMERGRKWKERREGGKEEERREGDRESVEICNDVCLTDGWNESMCYSNPRFWS